MNREKGSIATGFFFTILMFSFFTLLFTAVIVSAATVTINYPYANSFNSAFIIPPGDGTNISINVTVLLAGGDGNVSNLSYSYRASPTDNWFIIGNNLTHNLTQNQGNHSYQFQWNISTLTAGTTYELNVTARNTTVIIGTAVITGITIDHTYPTVTLEAFDPLTKKTKTTFSYGDNVLLRCTRSDATAGYNLTNISIQTSEDITTRFLELTTETATVSKDFDVTFSETRALGTYTSFCAVRDRAGLLNASANVTFDIVSKPPSGGSPFLDPEFQPPVATIIIGAGSESALGELTEVGTSRLIAKTGTAIITFTGNQYSFMLKEYAEDSATFTVNNNFDVQVAKKEVKPVDVDADGIDDISLELHNIFSKKADTTFRLLPVQQAPPSTQPGQETETTPQPITTTSQKKEISWVSFLIAIIILALLVFAVLHFLGRRERRQGPSGGKSSITFTKKDLGAYRQDGAATFGTPQQNTENYRQF